MEDLDLRPVFRRKLSVVGSAGLATATTAGERAKREQRLSDAAALRAHRREFPRDADNRSDAAKEQQQVGKAYIAYRAQMFAHGENQGAKMLALDLPPPEVTEEQPPRSITWGACGHICYTERIKQWVHAKGVCPVCSRDWQLGKNEELHGFALQQVQAEMATQVDAEWAQRHRATRANKLLALAAFDESGAALVLEPEPEPEQRGQLALRASERAEARIVELQHLPPSAKHGARCSDVATPFSSAGRNDTRGRSQAVGNRAPSLDADDLEFIKGQPAAIGGGSPCLVMCFSTRNQSDAFEKVESLFEAWSDAGLQVTAISQQPKPEVEDLWLRLKLSFPVAVDCSLDGLSTYEQYGAKLLPKVFLCKGDGTIQWHGNPLDSKLERMVAEACGGSDAVGPLGGDKPGREMVDVAGSERGSQAMSVGGEQLVALRMRVGTHAEDESTDAPSLKLAPGHLASRVEQYRQEHIQKEGIKQERIRQLRERGDLEHATSTERDSEAAALTERAQGRMATAARSLELPSGQVVTLDEWEAAVSDYQAAVLLRPRDKRLRNDLRHAQNMMRAAARR